MSVGEGSIRRAARMAGAARDTNRTAQDMAAAAEEKRQKNAGEPEEKSGEEPKTDKPAGKKVRGKTAELKADGKKAKGKTAGKSREEKSARKKSPEKKAGKKVSVEKKKASGKNTYEAYGIGQQLPTHLL